MFMCAILGRGLHCFISSSKGPTAPPAKRLRTIDLIQPFTFKCGDAEAQRGKAREPTLTTQAEWGLPRTWCPGSQAKAPSPAQPQPRVGSVRRGQPGALMRAAWPRTSPQRQMRTSGQGTWSLLEPACCVRWTLIALPGSH